jgi:hypothetical protein
VTVCHRRSAARPHRTDRRLRTATGDSPGPRVARRSLHAGGDRHRRVQLDDLEFGQLDRDRRPA